MNEGKAFYFEGCCVISDYFSGLMPHNVLSLFNTQSNFDEVDNIGDGVRG